MTREEAGQHMERLREEGDEMAWMMMVSALNRHYVETLRSREAMMKELRASLPAHEDVSPRLHAIGDDLLRHQAETVEQLADSAEAHLDMADLYREYDELRTEHRNLLNRLRAEREQLRNEMALLKRGE